MKKVLILHPEWDDFTKVFNKQMQRENVEVLNPLSAWAYKKNIWNMKIPHIIIKLFINKLKCPNILSVLNTKWYNKLNLYDYIIVFNDVPCKWDIINIMLRKIQSDKIKFWYYDSIDDARELNNQIKYFNKKKCSIDIYTFDRYNADKFGIDFVNQFYFMSDVNRYINCKIEYQVYFCGTDKGRLDEIIEIENLCKQEHISSYFYIKAYDLDNLDNRLEHKPKSYSDVLDDISKCKCIVEVNRKNQTGLTMRSMESIFLKKKLITNNRDIKSYDFYNPNNVYIYGEDNNLAEFVNRPYEELDEKIVEKYKYYNWINTVCGENVLESKGN